MSKDLNDISTMHIKLPYRLHIATKVAAMEQGMSMNAYVVGRLGVDDIVADAEEGAKILKSMGMTENDVKDFVRKSPTMRLDATKGTAVATAIPIIPDLTPVAPRVNFCKHGYSPMFCKHAKGGKPCK